MRPGLYVSLAAEGGHGVDVDGATRGEGTGQHGYESQQSSHCQQDEGVARTAFGPASQDLVQRKGEHGTGEDAAANTGTVGENTIFKTWPLGAPSAIRMPNSFVRCATEYETTL